jgi:hypothetical protein
MHRLLCTLVNVLAIKGIQNISTQMGSSPCKGITVQ